ncbi:hypothetical protein GCM10017714_23310 [Curtobacterium pusillum]|uniref:Uncharacterized protein n=1 Tax=Curtobacterium pusillum TaxID=69373 RepID=A0ABX2MHH8_9MICO|nr:DUF6226 family protein [Curtobacterium pusillum]NUU14901.1 hypothetical protein [Curtobacterium pusillum]GLK32463.1 hypothetical protein GCM10017610_27480 [Curtobacterium pusillum]
MGVPTLLDVRRAVASSWRSRPESTISWPDPHPDRAPLDEEYSRVTDPHRYTVVGARVRSWADALVALGLAEAHPTADDGVRLIPAAPGALPLHIGVRSMEGAPGTVVDLLVGDPPIEIGVLPDCGCDACDSGSADLLEAIDEQFVGVMGGGFVLIDSERSRIIAWSDGWSASGNTGDVAAAVAAARRGERRAGQRVLVGASWWSCAAPA